MKDLTQGSEARHIFFFALPMLIGNVFQQLYNTVDSLIVGRALGKSALAAVGVSAPIYFLIIALITGITMGPTILIAHYFGAKDFSKVKKTIDTTYIFLFFFAILFTTLGLIFCAPVLRLLRTPEALIPAATRYLSIIIIGVAAMFGYNSIGAILRGLGDSKTPLYFLIVATILNIILDSVFILVFDWGVAGAAWATNIAQVVSFLFGIYHLNKTHPVLKFKLSGMSFHREIFMQGIKIGLPTAVQQILVATGFMALSRIVNPFGTDTMAAYTAASRLDSFASMPCLSISAAVSTFVAQNLGAGKPERVKKGYLAALSMSTLISLAITGSFYFFGRSFIALFSTDPAVIEIGVSYLRIVSAFYIFFSIMFVNNGILRGAGDVMIPLFITLLSLWAIRIPLSAVLSKYLGPDGIWWGISMAWVAGVILNTAYILTGKWKRKKLISGVAEGLE